MQYHAETKLDDRMLDTKQMRSRMCHHAPRGIVLHVLPWKCMFSLIEAFSPYEIWSSYSNTLIPMDTTGQFKWIVRSQHAWLGSALSDTGPQKGEDRLFCKRKWWAWENVFIDACAWPVHCQTAVNDTSGCGFAILHNGSSCSGTALSEFTSNTQGLME